jgi:hypothetical protein
LVRGNPPAGSAEAPLRRSAVAPARNLRSPGAWRHAVAADRRHADSSLRPIPGAALRRSGDAQRPRIPATACAGSAKRCPGDVALPNAPSSARAGDPALARESQRG